MNDRPSFSIKKIQNLTPGPTGITATNYDSSTPTAPAKLTKEGYSSSEALFKNIDRLGEKLGVDSPPECKNDGYEPEYIEDDLEDDMSEEEAADIYFRETVNPPPPNRPSYKSINESDSTLDNFCRQCGVKFNQVDKFCGNCGNKRE